LGRERKKIEQGGKLKRKNEMGSFHSRGSGKGEREGQKKYDGYKVGVRPLYQREKNE